MFFLQAHQQHRRAEAHLRYKRFDEAIQCHHNAAELLLDAMKTTTSSVALESISLQHSYHLKQKDLMKSKKEQYDRVKRAMDNLRQLSKDPHTEIDCQDRDKIQVAIYKNIYQTDTLLNGLLTKKITTEVINKIENVDNISVEKSQQTTIEELQSLNQKIHTLTEQLMMQVEFIKDENTTLKEQVEYLEKERTKYLNLQSIESPLNNKFPIHNSTIHNVQIISPPAPQQPRVYNIPSRPQQPHFDLSAFKDD